MLLVLNGLFAVLVGLPLPVATPSLPVAVPSVPVAVPSIPALPVPTPTVPSLPIPTPTLPPLPVPTPSLPQLFPTPTPTPDGGGPGTQPGPTPPIAGGLPVPSATPAQGAGSGAGGVGAPLPATGPAAPAPAAPTPVAAVSHVPTQFQLPPGPLGSAIAIALFLLPALAVLWLLLLVRTWEAGRQWRSATLRLAVAGELGLRPRDLAGMPPGSLRALRSQLAFDELTGVLTRPAGMAALEREVARARRQRQPLSVVFADLDGLKAMNDTRGHAAGSALIRGAAQALKSGLRADDLVFRFGGDEFVCLLPSTALPAAGSVMQRIKSAASPTISFSYGIAEFERGDDEVTLLARADDRLYEAKAARPEGVGRKAVRTPLEERLRES